MMALMMHQNTIASPPLGYYSACSKKVTVNNRQLRGMKYPILYLFI
jgi:hypothetical protein